MRNNSFPLFSLWLIVGLWFLVSPVHEPVVPCESSPTPFYPADRWDYRIADYLNSMVDGRIGHGILVAWLGASLVLAAISFSQKRRSGIVLAVATIIFTGIVLLVSWPQDHEKPADAIRLSDLMEIQGLLVAYFIDHGQYPGISGTNQYGILSRALASPDLPHDPCWETNREWDYQYWVSTDGQKYLLKANFQTHFRSLGFDLDGGMLGASCGENGLEERDHCLPSPF